MTFVFLLSPFCFAAFRDYWREQLRVYASRLSHLLGIGAGCAHWPPLLLPSTVHPQSTPPSSWHHALAALLLLVLLFLRA